MDQLTQKRVKYAEKRVRQGLAAFVSEINAVYASLLVISNEDMNGASLKQARELSLRAQLLETVFSDLNKFPFLIPAERLQCEVARSFAEQVGKVARFIAEENFVEKVAAMPRLNELREIILGGRYTLISGEIGSIA